MSGTHFYLTLPSNASMDVFPDNKIGSYHVKLPQAVDLHGDWEVGLYSISYSNTWYTLRKLENHLYYSTNGYIFSKSASVDFGYYDTVKDLIDAINKTLLPTIGNDSIHMEFNPRTAKVKVYIKKKHGLAFFGKLSRMLGFRGQDTKLFKTTESPFVADLFSITAIYVYCNIVQPQIVGNTNVHLLRTIPVSGKSGDVITKTFTNIQYVPVQTKSFEDIEILLRSNTGDPVPFERGKVIATLYFRKQSYFS